MPSIGRSQSSDCTTPILDVFTKVNGVAADVSQLQFQIFEKVTNPGIAKQIFPATAGDKQSVSLVDCPNGGRLGQGHYHANWDVPSDQVVGTHEIRWFFKLFPNSTEQQFSEEFEVLLDLSIQPGDTYVSVQDIRNAGVTSNPPTDADIQASICLWQDVIDRLTRQWFRPIDLELYVDGTDSDALHFGVPIISIDEIKINNDTNALDAKYYKIYNANRYPSDKHNPRIKLIDDREQYRDIFTAPIRSGRLLFRKGRQNQYIKGTFGYVDENGRPPEAIRRALMKLVIEKISSPIAGSPPSVITPALQGIVKEEWTDGHRIRYEYPGGPVSPRKVGILGGISDDPEIQAIIRLYRAPIGLATPANPSYR